MASALVAGPFPLATYRPIHTVGTEVLHVLHILNQLPPVLTWSGYLGSPCFTVFPHLSPEHRNRFIQFGFTSNDNLSATAQFPHLLWGLLQFTKYFLITYFFFHFKNKGRIIALDVHLYVVGTQQAKQEKK